jgi:hypothetical protein
MRISPAPPELGAPLVLLAPAAPLVLLAPAAPLVLLAPAAPLASLVLFAPQAVLAAVPAPSTTITRKRRSPPRTAHTLSHLTQPVEGFRARAAMP